MYIRQSRRRNTNGILDLHYICTRNVKDINVQCVVNVRVTYIVYVLVFGTIVIGYNRDVHLTSMTTYIQWCF